MFHKGSVLGPLLSLIYINDLPGGIESFKVFADDTSLFSTVNNGKQSQSTINNYLRCDTSLSKILFKIDQPKKPRPSRQSFI